MRGPLGDSSPNTPAERASRRERTPRPRRRHRGGRQAVGRDGGARGRRERGEIPPRANDEGSLGAHQAGPHGAVRDRRWPQREGAEATHRDRAGRGPDVRAGAVVTIPILDQHRQLRGALHALARGSPRHRHQPVSPRRANVAGRLPSMGAGRAPTLSNRRNVEGPSGGACRNRRHPTVISRGAGSMTRPLAA